VKQTFYAISILCLVIFAACGSDPTPSHLTPVVHDATTTAAMTGTAQTVSAAVVTAITDTAAEKQKNDEVVLKQMKEKLAILAQKPGGAFVAKVKKVDPAGIGACEAQKRYDAALGLEALVKQDPEVAAKLGLNVEKTAEYVKDANLGTAKAFIALAKSGLSLSCDDSIGLYNGRNTLPALQGVRLVEEAIDRAAKADVSESGKELGVSPQALNDLLKNEFKKAAPALSSILDKDKWEPSDPAPTSSSEVLAGLSTIANARIAGCAIWSAVYEYGIPAESMGISKETLVKAEKARGVQG
jgi:hypothetical protein